MSTINSIPFRSTIFYRNDGTVAPLGTVFTIGTNGLLNFSNSLSLNTLTASSITGNITTLSSITASTILTTGNNIALGQSVAFPNRYLELGTDVVDSVYLDFHSKDSTLSDYSTRIQSLGGTTVGTGALNMMASTMGLMASSGVGIGTNAPGSTLEVYTNSGVGGTTQLNVTSFAGGSTTTNTSVLNLRIQGAGGGMVDNSISAQYNSSGVGTYSLAFKPQGTTVMSILGSGNVGIGTTTPVGALSVILDGNGTYNPSSWSGSYALFGPGANSTTGSAVAITYNTTGLYGSLICLAAGVAWRDMYYSANQHVFFTSGSTTERMRINTAGNVGIGTNAIFQLHLSTDSAAKPGSAAWTISSDERLKENIILADVDRCVEIIRAIPLKYYHWKDEVYTLAQVKDRSKLGWIAQDVEKVFPKAVGTYVFRYNQVYEDAVKEDGTTEKRLISEDVIEDCRDLNVDQLYAVMYGAIQKLISENDTYKTTNIAINEQFASLQARMDALEARLAA